MSSVQPVEQEPTDGGVGEAQAAEAPRFVDVTEQKRLNDARTAGVPWKKLAARIASSRTRGDASLTASRTSASESLTRSRQ